MTMRSRTCSFRLPVAALLLVAGAGCNQRHPLAENPVTPSPPSTIIAAPPAPGPVTLSGLTLTPQALTGGGTGHGTVLLNNAAPSGGLNVALSSDDPAVAVPPSVTVPAGRDSAD